MVSCSYYRLCFRLICDHWSVGPQGQPLHQIPQVLRRQVQPDEKQTFDCRSDGARRGNQQDPGGLLHCDEALEVEPHGAEIARDEYEPLIGRDSSHVGVGSSVRDDACAD